MSAANGARTDAGAAPGAGALAAVASASGGFARRPILVLEMDSRFWRDDPEVVRASLATAERLAALATSR